MFYTQDWTCLLSDEFAIRGMEMQFNINTKHIHLYQQRVYGGLDMG